MKQLFEQMRQCLTAGEDTALVSVIAGSGSTPRGSGARMLVKANGESFGTIGGGNVEFVSQKMAVKVIEEKASFSKGYNLVPNQAADLGMVCGGSVTVYFQYIPGGDEKLLSFCQLLLEQMDKNEDSWIITDITDETAWSMGFYSKSMGLVGLNTGADIEPLLVQKGVQETCGSRRYYSEPLVQAGTVYVFGGGHVAQETVPVLAHLGFRCVVLDDREEFATSKLFPDASEVILCEFSEIGSRLKLTPKDYAVIMSRGHLSDYVIEKQVLGMDAGYIGVMGSRKKKASVNAKLHADGFTEEDTGKIHTPIGMDIKAETPAEIAVSIAAELIAIRAEKRK